MQLKAIVFDYGGVLCSHPPDAQVGELAELCRLDRGTFLEAYWKNRVPYDRADITPQQYWLEFARLVGRTYTDEEIAEFRRRDVQFWVHLDSRMFEWAKRVRAYGLRTAVLSNLPHDLGEYLRHSLHLVQNFDHHTFSYELRLVKPEPGIYQHVIEGLGVEPGEALFLDDKIENVEGAVAYGLKAIQFRTAGQLSNQLNGFSAFVPPL